MSMCVTIQKKKRRLAGGEEVVQFIVPSMAIQRPDGSKTLIPNPAGGDVAVFESVEDAEAAIRRAGFDSEFEGQRRVNLHHASERIPGKQTTTIHRGGREDDWMAAMRLALPILVQRLNDREASVLTQSAIALGELHRLEPLPQVGKTIIPLLLKHLGHEDPMVRKAMADTLARFGAEALEPLKMAYQQARLSGAQNASHIRLTVLTAYSEILRFYPSGMASVLDLALIALEDDHWLVRSQAAQIIALAASLLREAKEL